MGAYNPLQSQLNLVGTAVEFYTVETRVFACLPGTCKQALNWLPAESLLLVGAFQGNQPRDDCGSAAWTVTHNIRHAAPPREEARRAPPCSPAPLDLGPHPPYRPSFPRRRAPPPATEMATRRLGRVRERRRATGAAAAHACDAARRPPRARWRCGRAAAARLGRTGGRGAGGGIAEIRVAQTPPRCDTEWLLQMLKEDGYWLRAHKAKRICKKLGDTFTCEAYYTDVRVWVPQLEFGVDPAHSGAGVGGGS